MMIWNEITVAYAAVRSTAVVLLLMIYCCSCCFWGFCIWSFFVIQHFVSQLCNYLDGEERAVCFYFNWSLGTVGVLWVYLRMPWIRMQCVIVVLSDLLTCFSDVKWAIPLLTRGPWVAHLIPFQVERMFTTKYKSQFSNT